MTKTFYSTKTYVHSLGLSCAFRQWRAISHCKYLHGYALEVRITFKCEELDERNWVVDFGSMTSIKQWLVNHFDHKTLVAFDDPMLQAFQNMQALNIADVVVCPNGVGCEKFAELIFDKVVDWLVQEKLSPRVQLAEVELKEHAGNSAIVRNND